MPNPLKKEKIIASFQIELYEDGQLNISGPINNSLLTLTALNRASGLILEREQKKFAEAIQKNQSRIIQPNGGKTVIPVAGKN